MTKREYRTALLNIISVLGPRAGCPQLKCDGCRTEMQEALRIAKKAYRSEPMKRRKKVKA